MFKPIAAAIAAVTLLAGPVSAVTLEERHDHTKIVEALDRANFSLYVNEEPICGRDKDRFLGAYIPAMRAIVICQEEKVVWDGEVIPFTEEDLDTLRHEAQHDADSEGAHARGASQPACDRRADKVPYYDDGRAARGEHGQSKEGQLRPRDPAASSPARAAGLERSQQPWAWKV